MPFSFLFLYILIESGTRGRSDGFILELVIGGPMEALYILNKILCLLLVVHLAVDHNVASLAGFLAADVEAAACIDLHRP